MNSDTHYDSETKTLVAKQDDVGIENPANVEIEGKISSIKLMRRNNLKFTAYMTSIILSGGLVYLFAIWFLKFQIWMTLSDADLPTANRVVVFGADDTIEILELKNQPRDGIKLKRFEYRLFKYIYSVDKGVFVPAEFQIENMTFSSIHKRYGQGLTEGEYFDHDNYYGKNSTKIPEKGTLKLLIDEVLSPFYIFQLFSIIIWCFDDYMVYSGIILFLSSISIGTTLYETKQTMNKIKEMAEFKSYVFVYRNQNLHNKLKIDSLELVPGDIIEVPEDENMPCDAILLNGTCIMNEAMLTGESIPVTKNALPEGSEQLFTKDEKSYILFAGTKCMQARFFNQKPVLALVTRTGFTTVKGELIRTMLFPKASNFKFYYDSFMFIGILAIMALVGFAIDLPFFLNSPDKGASILVIKCCEIVTVTVPPALPTCMAIGVNVSLIRLKDENIFCISPNKINEAGKINVFCFDKTGTLTEEGLDIYGTRTVFWDKNTNQLSFEKCQLDPKELNIVPENKDEELEPYINQEVIMRNKQGGRGGRYLYKKTGLLPSQQMVEMMACTHTLTTILNRKTQQYELIGDPLDKKMFESTGWTMEENLNQQYDSIISAMMRPPKEISQKNEFKIEETQEHGTKITLNTDEVAILKKFEFNSGMARMSVVVSKYEPEMQNTAVHRLHCKGAPEKMIEAGILLPETIPVNFDAVLEKYTKDGKRVLALATKVLKEKYPDIMIAEQKDLEKGLTFIGFLIMENKLKPITKKIIGDLHKAQIKTIMVTGDNALTAISVARQCDIVKPDQKVYLGELCSDDVKHPEPYVKWTDIASSSTLDEFSLEKRQEFTLAELGLTIDDQERDSVTVRPEEFNKIKPQQQQSAEEKQEDEKYGDNTYADLDPSLFKMDDDIVLAVTGKAFSSIKNKMESKDPETAEKYKKLMTLMLKKAVIFARMHPDEKALMIKNLQNQTWKKHLVGMCGDGANDCGALKTANVGISLSEAEASVAAPFTSRTPDISCVITLLRYGRAALATSFQCFKYMALYSIIQFTSLTIVYAFQIDLSNADYYYIDIIIILPISFTMAFSGAYKKLTVQQPTGRLISVPILTSVIGQAVIQIMGQVSVIIILFSEPWYAANKCDETMSASMLPCIENTSVFLVSIFQYVFVAVAFMVGKPFRKPFYTNFWFTFCVIFLTILNLILLFNPMNWEFLYANENDPTKTHEPITMIIARQIKELNFQYVIFVIVLINTCLTMIWERIVVTYTANWWKQHKKAKKALENRE
jgi:cation-transporting ATPase 13A3/4/5